MYFGGFLSAVYLSVGLIIAENQMKGHAVFQNVLIMKNNEQFVKCYF